MKFTLGCLTKVFAAACLITSFAPAAEAYLYASPSSVNFFDTPVGGFGGSQSVTIRNSDSKDAEGLNIFDNCYGDFQVTNYGCYGRLPSYGSCSLNVRFRPTREGYSSCSIQISSSTGGYATVNVSGRGVKRLSVDENEEPQALPPDQEVPQPGAQMSNDQTD